MLVDIGQMKQYIKPKADSTLRNMRKDALIEYIRTLEHNYNVAVSFNENQAKYIESLGVAPVVRCEKCLYRSQYPDENGFYKCGGAQTKDGELLLMVKPDFFCACGERRFDDA